MKKLCSAVLTAVMLTQGFGAVSFADATDQTGTAETSEVLYQQTFSDWDATSWTDRTAAPGMTLANPCVDGSGTGKFTNLKPYTETDGNATALLYRYGNNGTWYNWTDTDRNGAFDVIPFGKVIESGKIYVSMDFYIPNKVIAPDDNNQLTERDVNGKTHITLFNTSDQDYTVAGQSCKSTGEAKDSFIAADCEDEALPASDVDSTYPNHQSTLTKIIANANETKALTMSFARMEGSAVNTNGENTGGEKNLARESWHKLQIVIDCDNDITSTSGNWKAHPVKVYVDGEVVSEKASAGYLASDTAAKGCKGIGIYRAGYSNGGVRFDNIYVSHYTNTADVKMLEEETDISDKKVTAAFTDILDRMPTDSDFTVTDASGNTVKNYVVSGDNKKVTFDFTYATGVPKDGKVNISVNSTSTLKGSRTGGNVSGTFTTHGTEVLYQQTFSDWDATSWTENSAAPGMTLANPDPKGVYTGNYYSNLKPYNEGDGDESALMWNGSNVGAPFYSANLKEIHGAFDVIPFNKIIKDGKIYISMDFYAPTKKWADQAYATGSTDDNYANISNVITLFNTSDVTYSVSKSWRGTQTYTGTGDDVNKFIAADADGDNMGDDNPNIAVAGNYVSTHQSQLVHLRAIGKDADGSSKLYVNAGKFKRIEVSACQDANTSNDSLKCSPDAWHKLEIIVDCDATVENADKEWKGNPVTVYCDGNKISDASTAYLASDFSDDKKPGYKGIGIFRRGTAGENRIAGMRYDNIYVSHYRGEKQDSVKLLEADSDYSDKKVSIAFTEYLNKTTPTESDFEVVTNVGTPIKGYTVSGDARKVTFDFANATNVPTNGKVIISAKDTLTGNISGLNVSGSMEIPFGLSGTNVFEKQGDGGVWIAATSISGANKIRAHINVTNGEISDDENAKKKILYIIAKYTEDADGSLILSEIIKSDSVDCAANGGTQEVTQEITVDSNAIYKAFVWNADGYRPFMESAVIQ